MGHPPLPDVATRPPSKRASSAGNVFVYERRPVFFQGGGAPFFAGVVVIHICRAFVRDAPGTFIIQEVFLGKGITRPLLTVDLPSPLPSHQAFERGNG